MTSSAEESQPQQLQPHLRDSIPPTENEQLPQNPVFDHQQEEKEYAAWFHSRRVCDEFQEIFRRWYDRKEWNVKRPGHQHRSLNLLVESVRPCPVCELFVRSLNSKVIQEFPKISRVVKSKAAVNYDDFSNTYRVCLKFQTHGEASELDATIAGPSYRYSS
ncbi:hypothetical protein G7Y89_g14567 [Cudoniella acicularis]|uniref:Uncharacterized protein n=1 Tax=Cudoniella acicularis TaxID=354080 RepID=A0A8H4VT38_9HELO|nr:hypothetical protein G7Y89_g14567 [Cudoniella acicularis]